MRWQGQRRSQNVEDRRGGGRLGIPVGGGGGIKLGGGLGIIVLLLGLFFGVDLSFLTGGGAGGSLPQITAETHNRTDDQAEDFVKAVLGTTEDVWGKLFQQAGKTYQRPNLVLFSDAVQSACGFTSAAAGPFYCPGDDKVYIDLGFFRQLQQMGAGGDFAQAYVIAHEIGHHVQNQLGVSMAVQRRRQQVGKAEGNALSVRAELQADCYAGVWAHHAHKDYQLLEPGDLEEGMNAASKIGDDALMRQAGRVAHPDSFTHGSSQQRQQWLYRGLESGNPNACDTFGSAI